MALHHGVWKYFIHLMGYLQFTTYIQDISNKYTLYLFLSTFHCHLYTLAFHTPSVSVSFINCGLSSIKKNVELVTYLKKLITFKR